MFYWSAQRTIKTGIRQLTDLKTDYDFEIMKTNQSLENLTIKVFKEVSKILDTYNPEIVMVHGDTTTSFAASLAAFFKK